jgi:hypothetical protein
MPIASGENISRGSAAIPKMEQKPTEIDFVHGSATANWRLQALNAESASTSYQTRIASDKLTPYDKFK